MPTQREATEADRTWLYELHERAHRSLVEEAYGPWEAEQQHGFFETTFTDFTVFVVEDDGARVGALYLGTKDDDVWVELIETDPAMQGRGIGSSVLETTVEAARSAGRATRLQVHRLNPRARRLYERLGFEPIGETATHVVLRRAS